MADSIESTAPPDQPLLQQLSNAAPALLPPPAHDDDDDERPPHVGSSSACSGGTSPAAGASHDGNTDATSPAAGGEVVQQLQPEPGAEGAGSGAGTPRSGAVATPPLSSKTATVLRKIEKWWNYSSYGGVIEGSRVIPMKTPLTLELQERQARLAQRRARSGSMGDEVVPGQELGEQREHTIGAFVREQREQGRTVGLIIDLSNHDCLYAEDLAEACPDVVYRHFHFVAKEVPDLDGGCQRVARCITAYLATNPEHYVGIHCSYGFNRTGLVCCAYLIQELGFTVDQALAAFAAARPPGVKHKHFIEALRARYGAGDNASPTTSASAASSSGSGSGGGGGSSGGGGCGASSESGGKGETMGIIPPAEADGSEPAQAASLADANDSSLTGGGANNNETLGGDVREAILVALQQHQQQQREEEEEQQRGSQRLSSFSRALRTCGSANCTVS